jgi:hypothetical protein
VVALSAVPAAVIVLEPGLKPAELTRIARHRPERVLPGFPLQDPIAPRLRVRKSLDHRLPFIPRHKSIGDSTPLADVLADGAAAFRVSARLLPIRRDGVLADRVVALLFDAEAERHYWAMRQSG